MSEVLKLKGEKRMLTRETKYISLKAKQITRRGRYTSNVLGEKKPEETTLFKNGSREYRRKQISEKLE